MIIDKKNKYLFIGLYFSGSSAISKELITEYSGIPIFSKHTSVPYLLKKKGKEYLSEYSVLAVIRDPIEMTLSRYNKLKTNHNEIYTSENSYKKNGGWLSESDKMLFDLVYNKGIGFEEYLKIIYSKKRFNHDLSYNSKFITHTIQFENLNEGFQAFLIEKGLKSKRNLPIFNKTNKEVLSHNLSKKQIIKYFGGYYWYNQRYFPNINIKIPFTEKAIFLLQNFIQRKRKLRFDFFLDNNLNQHNYWD
jgi:hypothetical protein